MGSDATTSILFVGDMHLGRRPRRLPAGLAAYGLSPFDLGPAAAWQRTVEAAVDEAVDAVVLAGDLVDAPNARFEAFGHLQHGVQKLVAAGVKVYAVAGNHDVEVLPRLAGAIPDFHLLGAGGRWEQRPLGGSRGPAVNLLGWSFPRAQVASSPLEAGLPALDDAGPTLGVLHCDLDASGSHHAPVAGTALRGSAVKAWYLGHIHKPSLVPDSTTPGYLGSLVGLDPTETGPHGPWLVKVGSAGRLTSRQLPLAPLRWEGIDVVLEDLDRPAATLEALLAEALRRHEEAVAPEPGAARAVGCRIRLGGSCRDLTALRRASREMVAGGQVFFPRDTLHFIDRITVDALPTVDLAALARGSDPCALLARRLLALQQRDAAGEVLLTRARAAIRREARGRNFIDLEPPEPGNEELRRTLAREGYRALAALLAQREDGHVPA